MLDPPLWLLRYDVDVFHNDFVMNRPVLIASLLLLFFLLIAFVVLGDWGTSPEAKDPEQHVEERAEASPSPVRDEFSDSVADDLQRAEAETLVPEEKANDSPAVAAPGYVTFVGRCVEEGSLRPLAEVHVSLWAGISNRELPEGHEEPEPVDPQSTLTEADGRFEMRGPLGTFYQYGLEFRDQHHLPRSKRWFKGWAKEQVIDLGDVALPTGVLVRGIVRDQDGLPVPDFLLSLRDLPPGANGLSAGTVSGWTGNDGTFALDGGVPVGTWKIHVRKKGFALDTPKELTVREGDANVYLDLRAKRMPSLSGIIQDAEGNPIPKAYLSTLRMGSGMTESTRTNAKGAFTLFARRDSLEAIGLRIQAEGFAALETREIQWGTSGLVFALERLPSVSLLVREQALGKVVQDYHLLVGEAGAAERDLSSFGTLSPGESLADGSRVFTGPLPGNYSLYVIPRNQALRVLGPLEFQVPATEEPLVLEVERMREVLVEVLDGEGAPVANATVKSLDLVPDLHFAKQGWHFHPRGAGNPRNIPGKVSIAAVHSENRTNAEGFAKVYAPFSQGALVLQVESDFPFYLAETLWPIGSERLTIQLEPPAKFRGQVRNAPAAFGQYGLLLGRGAMQLSDYGHARVPPDKVIFPDENGFFEAENIQEGPVQIQVVFPPTKTEQAAGERSWWVHPDRLEPIRFEAAKNEIHELDLLTFALGSLEANFLVDGAPFGSGEIGLLRLGQGHSRSHQVFTADPQGRLILDSLAQGEYQAWLKIGGHWIATDGLASVSAGPRSTASYTANPHRVVLRFVDQAGKPLRAGTELEFHSGWYQVFQIGEGGRLVLEAAPRTPTRFSTSLPYHGSVIPFDTLEEGATYTVVCKTRD